MSSESKTEVNENESEEEEEKQPTKLEELQEEKEEINAVISDLKKKKKKTKNENTNELDLRLEIARLKLEKNGYQIEYENATDPNEKKELRGYIQTKENLLQALYAQLPPLPKQSSSESEEEKTDVEGLSSSLAEIELTPKNQSNGSAFFKSGKQGFGFLPTYTEFDPTYHWNSSLTQCLVPTSDEVNRTSPIILDIEQVAFSFHGETAGGGVQDQFLDYCKDKYPTIYSPGQQRMKTRHINEGIVTNSSFEDAHLKIGDNHLAVIEFKGPSTSIYYNVCQAAAYGTNFAITLLNKGLPREQCIVPVIASNGDTIVFGATIILQNTFPTYIPISKHLDLSNSLESKIAAAYLQKVASQCEKLAEKMMTAPLSTPITNMELRINDELWVKTIDDNAYRGGLGHFHGDNSNPLFISCGIRHMFTVLNRVYQNPDSRPFAEYPISIRTANQRDQQSFFSFERKYYHQLIYRNLGKIGYRIGTPNPFTQEVLFDKYVQALTDAVKQIHKAGVIHCDLYSSNVMWKSNDFTQTVDIKIIDWDCAHTLDEGQFHPKIKSTLCQYLKREPTFSPDHDLQYLKIFTLDKGDYRDDWIALASNEKTQVDNAFYNLFMATLNA